jgi:hypothetical protein
MIQILRFPPLILSTLTLITQWIPILADRAVDLIWADRGWGWSPYSKG